MIQQRLINGIRSRMFYFFYSRFFYSFGKKSFIISPLKIDGMKNISIGNNVYIAEQCWLAALPLTGSKSSLLSIGNGSKIGNFNHIFATRSIVIGEYVLTADKVYISDNLHNYEDVNVPIMSQGIKQLSSVKIGSGSWIGENVSILGACVGKNCVIGANSVVTKDIPDYSVAVGVPARIIKRYCFESREWRHTNSIGEFIVK